MIRDVAPNRAGIRRSMKRSLLPDAVESYVAATVTETAVQRRLREETARLPNAGMQIGPDLGALLGLLVRTLDVRNAIEVGTFTGYSALAVAMALPENGRLTACDVSDAWTAIGRRHWAEAGVADKIDLRLGPAADTLAGLLRERGPDSFDFAFIDADKTGYDGYYEACLALVRRGGMIALDNMIWGGRVTDPAVLDADTVALRRLNAKIAADARVDACLATIGDGVMLARRR
jgi:predicted O-methyltransferase YrrM